MNVTITNIPGAVWGEPVSVNLLECVELDTKEAAPECSKGSPVALSPRRDATFRKIRGTAIEIAAAFGANSTQAAHGHNPNPLLVGSTRTASLIVLVTPTQVDLQDWSKTVTIATGRPCAPLQTLHT